MLCTKCNETKSRYFFRYLGLDKRPYREGYDYECSDCRNERRREWRAKNPGKDNAATRRADYKRLYGITIEEYEQMLESQDSRCAICTIHIDEMPQPINARTKRAFDVDHCHDTGKIRGLLCHNCNKGLGNFKDNITFMTNAISYLIKEG